MTATVLLVRSYAGWHEVDAGGPIRREALLGLGALASKGEAVRVATRQLGVYANPREEITVDFAPPADDPLIAFVTMKAGDVVSTPSRTGPASFERILQITCAEDDNGRLTDAVVLKDLVRLMEERHEEALKKMTDGTMAGDSKVAQPVNSGGTETRASCCPRESAIAGGGGGDN